ncbi:MAG TPA: hypothetical protein VLL54_09995 [Pyrinomonadaceae bacterium]|nr:hypothetical protein [Pyrinomonadaceae bacterium]
MKFTSTLRFSIKRLLLLTLVSFVAGAALLGIAANVSKANRAALAHAERTADTKSGIDPVAQSDKHPSAPSAAVIVATLTDNITAATKVAPGGTINYTAVITNNGAAAPADNATNLNYSDTLDANTTLVAGSVHASPIAFNDTYNWVGNTQLDTATRALPAVTANDVAVNAPAGTDTFTVTAIAGGATALGGTVTLASPSGAFTYTPPLGRPNIGDGASVTDSFTYTITNSADPSLTATGTVTITLTGRVWYLQAGAAGDGRSNTPSSNPAAMSTAADKSTDVFYIFSNAASLNGAFSVDAGQQLLGQGVNLVVNAITLFSSAAPTPTTTNTAGNCVALAGAPGNNTLSGFNIGNCTGGTGITGGNVGTLTVSSMTINTNGGALDLTGVGAPTVSVVLGNTTSTGGARNVSLVGLNGTVTLAGGALSGATGNGLHMDAGTAGLTFSGTIQNTGGRQVNIINKTGGTVALSGAIGGTGTGIFMNANPGATMNFTGGIALSTGTNAAFTATGGGTVSATQNNSTILNTLTTTTGTALNVANTTISPLGFAFHSISSNGAVNGILLNNTGANGLSVTGDGQSDPANTTRGRTTAKLGGGTVTLGSGGTINNTTGPAISLTSTSNVVLQNLSLTGNAGGVNSGQDGIHATTVTGMTLDNCLVNGHSGNDGLSGSGVSGINLLHTDIHSNATTAGVESADVWNVRIDNLTGTSAITNSLFFDSFENVFFIQNSGASNLNLTITNSEFRDTSTAGAGNVGFGISADNTCVTTLTATGSKFANSKTNGFQYAGNTSSSGTIKVQNSVFDQDGVDVNIAHQAAGTTLTFEVSGNTMRQTAKAASSTSTNIFLGGLSTATSVMIGTVKNNVIGAAGVANSGSDLGAGIGVNATGAGTLTATVTGNTVNQVRANSGNVFDLGILNTAKVNLQVRNNTFNGNPAQVNPQYGMHINNGSGQPAETSQLCLDMGANTVNMPASAIAVIDLDAFPGTTANLKGYAGATNNGAQIQAFFASVNTVTGAAPLFTAAGGTAQAAVAACTSFVFPTVPQPLNDSARNHTNKAVDADQSTNAASLATTTESAALTVAPTATRVSRVSSKDNIASMLAKSTPKASAADVARIYRSERTLAHHAVRSYKNAFSQEPSAPTSGEIVALNTIATFPAGGKSITIKYTATMNTPPLARSVSTQGTVTANGGISVLTDDPEPVGLANPTVTLVDTLMTWNGVTSTDWNTATNWTQPAGGTQYAPGVSNPAVNDVVIPNVGNQPTIVSDIGIYSLNLANGRTLTITNPRILTIGGSPGGDLTLNGVISGGNLNMGTGTHTITNPGGTGSLSSTNVLTVLSGGTATLNNNLQAGAVATNLGGTFNYTQRTLSLNGSGAAFAIGGAVIVDNNSTLIMNGNAAQTISGVSYNNLTINNSIGLNVTGVTLTGNALVNGVLALTSSDLATGAFILTQPNTTASTGVSDVVGTVARTGGPFPAATALTFGNPNNRITFAAAPNPTTVSVLLAKAPPATYTAAVQRNYTISTTGSNASTATLRLRYLDSEVTGLNTEATLNLRRLRTGDGHWVAQIPDSVDTTNNFVETTGSTVVGTNLPTQWTFSSLAPTATNGVITGRITDNQGHGVEGAVVRLEGTQNRKFITDANGNYRFDNVETSGFYTITPSRTNYTFSPDARSFNQVGESTQAAFSANPTSETLNPLDTPEYFVRQHYIDFLGREPDEAGFNFWSDQILGCGVDQNCIDRKRENVSAAYFLSGEFQQEGGLVDGMYRASYGRAANYGEFMPDTHTVGQGVIVGMEGWESRLNGNKDAFAADFVNRPAFHAMYDGMESSAFVDSLISHTNTSFTPDERMALISGLANGTQTRADVLRAIAENPRFMSAKFNETFVMMEYYGYLRRDYDSSGFMFWLTKLNEHNGNFEQADMVKAFIISGEYRDRFPR